MSKFIAPDRETILLLSPSVNDWLPERHLARLVVEIVEALDLSELHKTYPVTGGWSYSPSMMVSLLFYAYTTGIQSSRKIENATYDSLAFRFITGNLHPDHDTIADFRVRFLPFMDSIFSQILKICVAMKLTKIGSVSLALETKVETTKGLNAASDGTKILANASKHKALSYEHATKLEQKIKEEIAKLIEKSTAAENRDCIDGINIPEELARRTKRLEKIAEAKVKIEERVQERYEKEKSEYNEKITRRDEYEKKTGKKTRGKSPKEPTATPKKNDQINLTDEESRIMPKAGKVFVQAYNAQATVDMDSMFILTTHVSQATNDKQEMSKTVQNLQAVESTNENIKIEAMAADAGYYSENNLTICEEAGYQPLIPDKRESHNTWLQRQEENPSEVQEHDTIVDRVKKNLKTDEGKEIYTRRKTTIEPVFGIIKTIMNFTRFSMRGLENANNEWAFVSAAWNIKRLFKLAV